jgi:hypothetical protein
MVTTGYVFLVLGVLSCTLSYCAPFWILFPWSSGLSFFGISGGLTSLYKSSALETRKFWTAGLWGACDKSSNDEVSCTWFWQNDFYTEKGLPDWHKATQGLFGAGVILLFVAFLLCTFHICCRCCKESFSIGSVIGSFMVTGTICVAVGIGLYGGFMAHDYNVSFEKDSVSFYWGYFVGIAGAAMALVAAILFYLDSCCVRTPTGYHMTRVV